MIKETELMFEQYKMIVNSAIKVTEWRQATNKFYLAVNSALITAVTYLFGIGINIVTPAIGVIGIVLSIIWRRNLKYYKQLNKAKFKVIYNIEKKLPLKIFMLEQKYYLDSGGKSGTEIEAWVPAVFILVYIVIFILGLLKIINII